MLDGSRTPITYSRKVRGSCSTLVTRPPSFILWRSKCAALGTPQRALLVFQSAIVKRLLGHLFTLAFGPVESLKLAQP